MKTKPTLFNFWKTVYILVLATILIAHKTNAQSTTFSRPGFSMDYKHDGTNWNHIANTTSTYNSNGQSLEDLSVDPVTNQNKFRRLQTYDSHGNRLTFHTYNWVNMTWQLASAQVDSFNYTSSNKIASHYIFDAKVTPKGKLSRYINTYDQNDNLIEEISSVGINGAWETAQKIIFTYNANNILTQKENYLPDNGGWVLQKTETFSGWHTPTLPIVATTTFQNSSLQRRHTNTLGQNGSYVEISESFHGPTNTWRYMSRRTVNIDAQNNYIGSKIEYFNNNAWQYSREDEYLLTYNNQFDITQKIFRYPDYSTPSGTPAKDQDKYIYSNFQYFNRTLGTPEIQKKELALNVYPNPATGIIRIEPAIEKSQQLTATIKDITGKNWMNQTFKPSEEKILNIEGLPKGIYLLQLKTETGSLVKRIVKQ